MESKKIRQTFIEFFENKGHKIVPSAPMVVKNDPTLMFTNAGMNQFKEIFLGHATPEARRVADTQKCLRVSGKHNDLEEVGHDNYHHTMFEMLGNWSFNDYFKQAAIDYAWELLVDVFGIDPDRLYATVFEGSPEDNLQEDREAYEYWQKYLSPERILTAPKEENFWEMGDTGPCGPCSEIHIDFRSPEERKKYAGNQLVNQDHPLVIELWNLVFIQFNKKADGSLETLPQQHIDTGMGFERLCMVLQNKYSAYETDIFQPIIGKIEEITGYTYQDSDNISIAFRVIADHLRAIAFAVAEGELPSNTGPGYVIRRILRRAVRYAYNYLHRENPLIYQLVPALIDTMGNAFPELESQNDLIAKVIREEEQSFLKTLATGIRMLDQLIDQAKQSNYTEIDGKSAFKLYDTYGFPVDLTRLIVKEHGLNVNEKEFEAEMQKQKSRSREASVMDAEDWIRVGEGEKTRFLGYDQLEAEVYIIQYRKIKTKKHVYYQLVFDQTPFYGESGGQVGDVGYIRSEQEKIDIIDTKLENNIPVHLTKKLPEDLTVPFQAVVNAEKRTSTANNHTATHLLHDALRKILGQHVEQKGSLVHPDYLRFDFSHFQKVSSDEIRQVEHHVNAKIRENLPLEEQRSVPIDTAKQQGAIAFFGEKYADHVRTVRYGNSFELCGGTHAPATGQLGFLKITTETSVASGIRRLEAITGEKAEQYIFQIEDTLERIKDQLKNPKNLEKSVKDLVEENNRQKKQLEAYAREQMKQVKQELLSQQENMDDLHLIVEKVPVDSSDTMKSIAFQLKNEVENLVLIMGAVVNGKPNLTIMISENLVHQRQLDAGAIIREAAKEINGGGGGQAFFATAGGKNPEGIEAALQKAREHIQLALSS